jgi:D-aminoacyl-tRNA deacylase
MKLVVQRVSQARVDVEGKEVARIGEGLLIFLCIERGDNEKLAEHYARKVAGLRIFSDEQGKMNLSIQQKGGEVLVISQFTLAGDVERGRRPSFIQAAPPALAEQLYRYFADQLQRLGVRVGVGVFQAYMHVALVNDGPVTILLGKTIGENLEAE